MANIVHFRGEENLFELGYQGESIDKTDVATAVTPTEALAYVQSLDIDADESLEDSKFINGGLGRNISDRSKGSHIASAKLTFHLAKDLDQTDAQEGYLLSMAIDGLGTDATNVYTFPAIANEYGTDYLKVFTIEAGPNKASNVIAHKLTGCIVAKETFHCEEGKFCEWRWDIMAVKHEELKAFTAGSIAESTEKRFHWGDVEVKFGTTGGLAAVDGCEMFEHTIDNQVKPEMDLANAATTRSPTLWECGTRKISGTMRTKLTTATDSGQDLWEILYGDASGTASPTETVTLKDFQVTLYVDGTYYVKYTYHDVAIGKLSHSLTGEGIQRITIPWTAKHIVLEMKMNASATEPTNWS